MTRDDVAILLASLVAAAVVYFAWPKPKQEPKRTCTDALFETTALGASGASGGAVAGPTGAGIGALFGIGLGTATDAQFRECVGDTLAQAQRWAARNPDEAVEVALLFLATPIAVPLIITKEVAEWVFGEDVFGLGAAFAPDSAGIFYVVARGGANTVNGIAIHGAGTADMKRWPVPFRLQGEDYSGRRKPIRNEQLITKAYAKWQLTRGVAVGNKTPQDFVNHLKSEAEYNRRNPVDLRPKPARKVGVGGV